jgi:hypothetical protein
MWSWSLVSWLVSLQSLFSDIQPFLNHRTFSRSQTSSRKDFFFFWWDWSLNSEFHACKTGTLPLEPLCQPKKGVFLKVQSSRGSQNQTKRTSEKTDFILLKIYWLWVTLLNSLFSSSDVCEDSSSLQIQIYICFLIIHTFHSPAALSRTSSTTRSRGVIALFPPQKRKKFNLSL